LAESEANVAADARPIVLRKKDLRELIGVLFRQGR